MGEASFEVHGDESFTIHDATSLADGVVWVAVAAVSGVVGNSADRWLRKAVRRRYRWRLVRLPEPSEAEAVEIALLALAAAGDDVRGRVTETEVVRDLRGRWLVTVHASTGSVYTVMIPRHGHRPGAAKAYVRRH